MPMLSISLLSFFATDLCKRAARQGEKRIWTILNPHLRPSKVDDFQKAHSMYLRHPVYINYRLQYAYLLCCVKHNSVRFERPMTIPYMRICTHTQTPRHRFKLALPILMCQSKATTQTIVNEMRLPEMLKLKAMINMGG